MGEDAAASTALKYLHELGVDVYNISSKQQTGKVLILYQPDDQRIMIADRGANRDFRMPEDRVISELSSKSDLLYISGYMLLNETQRKAVHKIAKEFQTATAKVLVDMVPHDVWQTKSWDEYLEMCSCADYVAVELHTLSMFCQGVENALNSEEAVELLLESFEFCIVRINNMSDFIVADRTQKRVVSIPYRRVSASLRFTDRVIAHAIHQYISEPKFLFESSLWIEKARKAVGA
jgi:sugar/nucleoside kinase (ribokinase family)